MVLQTGSAHAKAGPKDSPRSGKLAPDDITVSGTITDNRGETLFGVRIYIKGVENDVFSDKFGSYSIPVIEGDVLVFSLKGYLTQEVIVSKNRLDIVLVTDFYNEETKPILYDQQTRNVSITSSSTVGNTDLIKSPVTSVNNALTGRMSGLQTFQSSGQPGFDIAALYIRGNNPLTLINGIPRDYASIDPEQVESITILKDGLSAVMLGQRSSKGAVLIKTKEGKIGKQVVSFTAQSGIQQALRLPKPLEAWEYATLYNEAKINDGSEPVYSDADIESYKRGDDPLSYPNTKWFDEILEKSTPFSRYNVGITGGGSSARYFVGADFLNQGGIYRQDSKNTYSTNTDFKRYSVRSNIDIDVTPTTVLNLNLFGRIQAGNEPTGLGADLPLATGGTVISRIGSGRIFELLYSTPNNASPVFNPDGSLAGNKEYQTNLWGASTQSGYFFNNERDVSADISVKKDLSKLSKGLWVKALASFNTSVSEYILRSKRYEVFEAIVAADTTYQKFGQALTQENDRKGGRQEKSLYVDFSSGITRDYGKHHLDGLLKVNIQSNSFGRNLPENYTNFAGRAMYNYDRKYLAEAAVSVSGLNRYPTGNRYGLFYGVGLGWNMRSEDFMKDISWINELKPRVNYARTGNSNPRYFVYNQYYTGGSGYAFGAPAGSFESGVREDDLANEFITWEKANQFNVGLDLSLFKNKLSFSAEYFNNRYFDLLDRRGKNSAILGADFPLENIGINNHKGLEFDLTYSQKIGEYQFFVSPNVSTLKETLVFTDEITREYSWSVRTGNVLSQPFGYIADGFYTADNLATSPKLEGYTPQAGDIRYKDLNDDDVIDDSDVAALKNNRPTIYYGVNLGFQVKGFDFSALIQGIENRYIYLGGAGEWAFLNNGLGQAWNHNIGRWTPETAQVADHPRLGIGSNVNNHATSSFWLHRADYVRLKNVEFGYTLPAKFTKSIKLSSVRLFINGVNLLTSTSVERVDPEVYGARYPLQRVFNGGVNVKF